MSCCNMPATPPFASGLRLKLFDPFGSMMANEKFESFCEFSPTVVADENSGVVTENGVVTASFLILNLLKKVSHVFSAKQGPRDDHFFVHNFNQTNRRELRI
eukprot:m.210080 g.210080  ORF g.210080 m.210080 type:complete len:102 (+) comp33060_c0_seq1:1258-1563(+)